MRFERVVIVNPPNPPGCVSNKDSMGGFGQLYPKSAPPFPPLDIPYLAGSLTSRGIETSVIEAGALGLSAPELCARIAREPGAGARLVLVRTSLPTVDWDLGVCAEIRREAAADAGIAIYGPAVPPLLRRIEAEPALDYIVLGEPEETVGDLVSGAATGAIPGLMHRTDGSWTRNAERAFERDLDARPLPRWDLLPYDRYVIPKSSTSGRLRFLPMLSSRGCPFGCSYCPYPVGQGLKWRFRSPASVADEMEYLVREFQVEHVLFRDPMFSMNQARVVALCDEIVARGLRVSWKCETRVDCLDEPTIASMARAGCSGVNFGVESVAPEVQKGVHRKPILPDEFVRKVALCRRYGIATFAFFVVGLPGDTLETILNTIAFAVRLKANWSQFTVATPFIGTPMHQWAAQEGFIDAEFYRIANAHSMSPGNEHLSGADIERLYRFAHLLQEGLLNRKGVLKNERRRGAGYALAKTAADGLTHGLAHAGVGLARRYFRRSVASAAGAVAS